jgi:hypothetical protein
MNQPMTVERQGARLMVRAAWTLATILTAAPLLSIFHQAIGWGPGVVAMALAAIAALRPFEALLILSGLGPFAATILALTRSGSATLNFFEATVLAILLGCAARRAVQPQRLALPAPFASAAATLFSLALASVVTSAIVIWFEDSGTPARELLQSFVFRNYLIGSNTLTSGMLFAEGVALMVIAADACGGDRARQHRMLGMMVIGATAAALLNVLRIFNSAMAQPHPFTAFLVQFAAVRVNMHFPDLNAAGSYFALLLFIALGFVREAPIASYASSLIIAAGLWIAGSRTALAAALATGGVGVLLGSLTSRRRLMWSVSVVAFLAMVAFVGWKWYPEGRNLEGGGALSYRITIGKAAMQLIATHPVFGIGPGNFSEMSGLSNNAHNNYLQIASELGIPTLLVFVSVVALAIRASWREAHQIGVAWGVTMGLLAYLLTCLAGHPLLVHGAAYPFWMAVGVAASFEGYRGSSVRLRWTAIAAILIVVATLPLRVSAAVGEADFEHSSAGFSKWQQQQGDGSRYRWAGGRATFYVAPAARSIRIPLRSGPMAPAIVEVRIYLDGVEANQVILRAGQDVTIVRLNLIRRVRTRFARIDLESRIPGEREPLKSVATDAGGVLMVGRLLPEN